MTTMGADNSSDNAAMGNQDSKEPSIKGRYVLHHCLSTTSLMALYWAHDEQSVPDTAPDSFSADANNNLLLAIINPGVAQLPSFENTLRTNWGYFAAPKSGQPHVVDYGKEPGGQLWFAMRDTNGLLLSERLQELDDRSLPADTAHRIAQGIYHTSQGLQDKPYGFLEPGIIQKSGDDNYKLLNAPIVRTLSQVLGQQHEHKLALHSPYLSPSVAVGDLPTTEDDSFAIAAIFYELLTHQAPFAKRSTLEAAVHGDAPHTVKKLNEKQWQLLKNALAFQRSPRPTNPDVLLKQLSGKQRSKLLYPVAAVLALGITAFAAYHLVQKVDVLLPSDTTASTAQLAPDVTSITSSNTSSDTTNPLNTPPTPPTVAVDAPQPTANIETTTDTILTDNTDVATTENTTENETNNTINELLEKARQAIADKQLIADDKQQATATTYLQALFAKAPEHEGAQTLLNELISEQHKQAKAALEAKDYTQAEQQLETTDALISEFALADFLIPQARLEATLESKLHKQTRVDQYLERAQAAMQRDKLMEGDDEGEGAIDYLRALMLEAPDHPEGQKLLKDIVDRQHRQARTLMRKKELAEAREVLDSSQRIIGRYRFDELAEKQLQLEDDYRDRQLSLSGDVPATPTTRTTTPAAETTTTSRTTENSTTPRQSNREQATQPQRPTRAPSTTNTQATQPTRTTAPEPATSRTNTASRSNNRDNSNNQTSSDGLILLPMPEPQVSFEAATDITADTTTDQPSETVEPATPTTPTVTSETLQPSLPDNAFDYALPAIENPTIPQVQTNAEPETAPAPIAATPINITTPSPVVSYEEIAPATVIPPDVTVNNQAIFNESTNNVQIPETLLDEDAIPEIPLSTIEDGLPVLPLPSDDAAQ